MSVEQLALLAGLYGVPCLLLAAGHRVRRKSARMQRVFVFATAGYLLAALTTVVAALVPSAPWTARETLRGLLGWWMPLAAPGLGAVLGWWRGTPERRP
jgi:hypothetical protein